MSRIPTKRLKPLPQSAPEKPPVLDRLVIIFIYLACLFGASLGWMLEHDIPGIRFAALGAGVGAAVFIVAFLLPEIPRWIVACAAVALWGGAVFWLRGAIVRGAVYAGNLVYSRFTGFYIEYQFVPPPGAEGLAPFYVFLFFVFFLFSVLLAGAVLGMRSPLLTLLLAGPFFWFSAARTGFPPLLPTLLLACGWCGLLFQPRARTSPAAGLRLAAIGLAAVLAGAVVLAFPAGGYEANAGVLRARADVEAIDLKSDLPRLLGIGPGGRTVAARGATKVNLARTGNLELDDGVAFSVLGDIYFATYLRGFSCSEYTGSAWRQNRAEAFEAAGDFSPLACSTSFENFYRIMNPFWDETAADAAMNSSPDSYFDFFPTVAIRPGEKLPYSPAPYLAARAASGGETLPFAGDAFLQSTPGLAEYKVAYYPVGDMSFLEYSERGLFPVSTQTIAPGITYEDWILLSQTGQLNESHYVDVTIEIEDVLTDEERAYIEYIGEHYTRLPGDVADTLRGLAAEAGIPPAEGPEDWHRTAHHVGNYVRNAGVYTRTPGIQPRGADFVEYFLTQSRAGYCVHFASAATAMLQALGVPARYVEGFTVPQDSSPVMYYGSPSVMQEPEVWTDILNSRAHAWVEVWEPGLGWVPLEVTPGGSDAAQPKQPKQPALTGGPAPQSEPAAESASGAPSSSQPDASSSPPAGGAAGTGENTLPELPEWARLCVIWCAVAIAAALALLLLLRDVRKRRQRRFADQNRNRAALEIYAYLEMLGRFGAPPGEKAYDIACKAKFNPHALTEEEYGFLLDEARLARESALASLPAHKKLWFWLRGL